MTEYWKSIPKKFCDACKCWFQDNKASIDFHERGTRHKANIEQKIRDSQLKGKTNKTTKTAMDTDMQKIEAAAMAAYANDVANNPSLIKSYGAMPVCVNPLKKPGESSKSGNVLDSIPIASPSSQPDPKPSDTKLILGHERAMEAITSKQKKLVLAAAAKKWKEAKAEDGFSYFVNSDSGETRWDAPPEGYLSLADQRESGGNDSEHSVPALRTKPLLPALGTPSALGGWIAVTPPKASALPDLGLIPATRSAASELASEMHTTAAEAEVTGIQFKTKTAGNFGLAAGQEAAFKKRKLPGDPKRQVRKREE